MNNRKKKTKEKEMKTSHCFEVPSHIAAVELMSIKSNNDHEMRNKMHKKYMHWE